MKIVISLLIALSAPSLFAFKLLEKDSAVVKAPLHYAKVNVNVACIQYSYNYGGKTSVGDIEPYYAKPDYDEIERLENEGHDGHHGTICDENDNIVNYTNHEKIHELIMANGGHKNMNMVFYKRSEYETTLNEAFESIIHKILSN